MGKILVVEDNMAIGELIEDRVSQIGHTVVKILPTGEEAIEFCRATPPDLVIMDVTLDGEIDGIEAGAVIKKECSIPIVFMTAHGGKDFIERVQQAKPDGFILKPFSMDNIRAALKLLS